MLILFNIWQTTFTSNFQRLLNLLYLMVGITGLFAIMYGFSNFVPHFLAMGVMYVYVRGGTALAAQLRLNSLVGTRRSNPGLRAFDGGWNKGQGKDPKDSGWVH